MSLVGLVWWLQPSFAWYVMHESRGGGWLKQLVCEGYIVAKFIVSKFIKQEMPILLKDFTQSLEYNAWTQTNKLLRIKQLICLIR